MATKGDLTTRVLEAARKLFIEKGYSNTTLVNIGRAVGTSETGVLRVCESKAVLLQMVYGLCWQETNSIIDATAWKAARVDSDPRFIALAVIKGLLERYERETPMRQFMISHFFNYEVTEIKPTAGDTSDYTAMLLSQFDGFIERMGKFAANIVESDNGLAEAGVTSIALREYLAGINYGIQISWFAVDRGMSNSRKMTIREALDPLITFLYPAIDAAHRNAIRTSLGLDLASPDEPAPERAAEPAAVGDR